MSATSDQNARVLDQFSQQAEAYAALTSKGGGQTVDPMIAALELSGSERLLDVGCGAGQFAVSAARRVKEVVGVDLTPAMLAKAQELQLESGCKNIEWRQADSVSLPVADATFDVVTSRAMFHHAADPKGTLAEMRRACAPGGRIAVLDLTPAPQKAVAFDCIEILRDPSHSHALTADELRGLGAELGLEELLTQPQATSLPLEPVLVASFPPAGLLQRVRELYARDAASGADALGFSARIENGEIWVTYPMTLMVWRRGE
jgi:ubiquinone/menaquinone biosynthesis C-methylase UbiE